MASCKKGKQSGKSCPVGYTQSCIKKKKEEVVAVCKKCDRAVKRLRNLPKNATLARVTKLYLSGYADCKDNRSKLDCLNWHYDMRRNLLDVLGAKHVRARPDGCAKAVNRLRS